MAAKKNPPAKAPPKPRKTLPCKGSDDPNQAGRNFAAMITAPEVSGCRVISVSQPAKLAEEIDVPGMLMHLRDEAAAVNRGDLTQAEAMLMNQATALQSLFVNLTERGMTQSNMPDLESFMRLALRAQSQCRATIETLATIKNPPIVYARQANVTSGPQQINNGSAAFVAGTREKEKARNELLEAEDGQRMDIGASGTAGCTDSAMAALGTLDWTANR